MKSKYLILPFAAIVFLILSCSKPEEQRSGDEGFEPHPTWTDDSTNNFWEKGLDDGIAFDPGWEKDTSLFY